MHSAEDWTTRSRPPEHSGGSAALNAAEPPLAEQVLGAETVDLGMQRFQPPEVIQSAANTPLVGEAAFSATPEQPNLWAPRTKATAVWAAS